MTLIQTYPTAKAFSCDGVQTVWDFSFTGGYIDRTHVKAVYTDVSGAVVPVSLNSGMFIGSYQLSITPPLGAGGTLTIYRSTPKGLPIVDFADGARISETSLDIIAKQAVFVASETLDGFPDIRLVNNRASKLWGFDADGNFAVVAPGEQSASALALSLAGSNGSSQVGFITSGAGAVPRTMQDKGREWVSAGDFGAVSNGSTDDTAKILLAAASGAKIVTIPPNTLFNRATLLATLPSTVVCFDLSSVSDFSSAGQTTKHVGIISSDIAESDTHWAVESGHHSIITSNNYGTAATASGDERKASWLWAAGQYALGGVTKRGFRGAAIQQFTKESGGSFWKWQIRSIAPWPAIDGAYEDWAAGQVISGAGVYRLGPTSQQYVSTGAGTAGATGPTHTTGTVSDGGVSWTWIDSGDRTLFQCDEYGRWIVGAGNTGDATWNHKVGLTDPNGQYRFQGVSRGVSKTASLKLTPTNAGATDSLQPYLLAQDGVGLRIMNSTGSSDLAFFSDAGGLHTREVCSDVTQSTSTGATPSANATGTLLVANAAPQNITAISNGTDGQTIQLVFSNANTTMVSSATLTMAGSVNVTPTAWSVITMFKVPAAISDRWIEVSRSIK